MHKHQHTYAESYLSFILTFFVLGKLGDVVGRDAPLVRNLLSKFSVQVYEFASVCVEVKEVDSADKAAFARIELPHEVVEVRGSSLSAGYGVWIVVQEPA